jgi:NAD(P)-dependent dehydrogenase (short-subunit alcohol dehydrogenase family)
MTNNTFANQTAIITGAGIGIGYAIANALVRQGANVLLNDFDPDLARQAADSINRAGLVSSTSGESTPGPGLNLRRDVSPVPAMHPT